LVAADLGGQQPGAHPQEDHLLPLMVAVGAAGNDQATCVDHQDDFFGGITGSSFYVWWQLRRV
jgi:hypothetical protein